MIDISAAFKQKRVMITGGLGFIGSNLAHRLVDLAADVLLVDDLIPGHGGNLFNVEHIKDKLKINLSDVRTGHSLKQLVTGQDYIFNLAGTHNYQDSLDDPFIDLELNCRTHLNLLEACRKVNPDARIIFSGSRNQYGRIGKTPVSENHPRAPIEPNGIHNITAEHYHLFYNNTHGLKTTCLRLTNTYGPRHIMQHHKQGVVNWFIKLILDNREVYIFGDGKQIRDLNYVDDVVEAILLAAATDETVGEVYNLGGTPVCLEDLVKKLIELTGKGGYKLTPYPEQLKITEVGDYIADYSKIKNQLGWEPKVSLDNGLRKTISFYEKYRRHYW
jgi:UDP-glucose 4-epimerase